MVPLHRQDVVRLVVLGHARHGDRADHPAERPHAVADAHLQWQSNLVGYGYFFYGN